MTTNSVLTRIPDNTNFLQSNKFSFVFPTLPFLKYFCQSVSLPGIATEAPMVPTPLSHTFRHGDHLNFDKLTITAIVDEDLMVWEETQNWIMSLTAPDRFSQYYRNLNTRGMANSGPYHDGILTINTNANIPNIRFDFSYCNPISISALQLSATDSAETVVTVDIVFRYDQYKITRLTP